jgi:hypothetical protein
MKIGKSSSLSCETKPLTTTKQKLAQNKSIRAVAWAEEKVKQQRRAQRVDEKLMKIVKSCPAIVHSEQNCFATFNQ